MSQTVYHFGGNADHSDPRQKDKTITGGKGANLAEMASIGLPVPPGFTITTEECLRYLDLGGDFSDGLQDAEAKGVAHVEQTVGKKLGDAADPLLVSVRSGAAISMPGMMDTVLNLGLNDETVKGLAKTSGDARFAWDSYRRFIQMYSDVVLGLDHGLFEEALEIGLRYVVWPRLRDLGQHVGALPFVIGHAVPIVDDQDEALGRVGGGEITREGLTIDRVFDVFGYGGRGQHGGGECE